MEPISFEFKGHNGWNIDGSYLTFTNEAGNSFTDIEVQITSPRESLLAGEDNIHNSMWEFPNLDDAQVETFECGYHA